MNVLNIGDPAPDFNCKDQNGKIINLSDYLGKKLVIFFYPKANTPEVAFKNATNDIVDEIKKLMN